MRIIHLIHYFPPKSFGGTQNYVASIADIQQSLGHQVLVISGSNDLSRGPVEEDEVRESGVQANWIYRDANLEPFSAYVGSDRIEELILAKAQAFGADVVHLHHWEALSSGVVARLRGAGFSVIVTLHDLYTTCMRFFRMPKPTYLCDKDVSFEDCARCVSADLPQNNVAEIEAVAERRVGVLRNELNTANAVYCVSEAQKEMLESLPTFAYRGLRVRGIGVPGALRVEEKFEPKVGPLKLVQWGGLDPRKGIHLIAQAMVESGRSLEIELHVYGRTIDQGYLDEIKAIGAQVTFHGFYETEDLLQFSKEYHLAVFPFIAIETYALAVDEALHIGIPIVVSDRGAPPERIGERGCVVPPEDSAGMARLFGEILENPSILTTWRAGRHFAKTIEEHVPLLLADYEQILQESGS